MSDLRQASRHRVGRAHVEEVLPDVPYAPLVFTIPKILRPAFLFRPKLYGDFCRAAYRVVREALEAQFPELDRPVPAFLASSQSFGNLLNQVDSP